MTGIMEQPILICLLGALAAIILASAWVKTGETKFALGVPIALAVFGSLLGVERLVKTDREQVRETLYEVADAVKRNDFEAAVGYIHPQRSGLKFEARRRLRGRQFNDARITNIRELVVDYQRDQPVAHVEFTARAGVGVGSGFRNVVSFVIVQMKQDGEQWKISNYELREFGDAFRKSR